MLEREEQPEIEYAAYVVELIGTSISASIPLTPEFLQENDLVPDDWTVEWASFESEDTIQEVRFDNGFVVRCHPDSIEFILLIERESDLNPPKSCATQSSKDF